MAYARSLGNHIGRRRAKVDMEAVRNLRSHLEEEAGNGLRAIPVFPSGRLQ